MTAHRRPEFDQITAGWGGDSFDDLTARIELAAEFKTAQGGLLPAEEKIASAMIKRQVALGIERGDFAPYL